MAITDGDDWISHLANDTITYKPNGGAEREISAVVTRETVEALSGVNGLGPRAIIQVNNSVTTGIASSEVDLAKDLVNMVMRLGETAQDYRLTEILAHDEGMVTYEVR